MRPAVQWFAECMESRLAMNESRSDLPRPTRDECLAAIDRNKEKAASLYASSLNYDFDDPERDAVVRDAVHAAADVANWLLMLLEVNINDKPVAHGRQEISPDDDELPTIDPEYYM